MATIKHLTSKNSNYAAAESYLTFQHNEYTGLPILDEKGRPKLRDSYLLDTLECGESPFALACLLANRKYGKNGRREDVKTHHIWRHPPKRMLIYSCAARTAGHTKYIHQLRPEGRSGERPDHGAGASPWLAVLQGQFPRSSRHRLHPPGRSQQCREYPRPHRHRQLACPHRGTAALHGQAVRLGSGQEAPLHLCHAPAPPCRCHGNVRASRSEPDQFAGSSRRPCFRAGVLGAAARTTPPRLCQRQACRRRAAAHPDRLSDRAGQAAKADLLRAEQDHHLRGIFCIAHAGTRHRREGEPRPVELLPTRPDKVHHRQETEQEVLKIITADQILILCKIYS